MIRLVENTVRDGSYLVDFQFSLAQSNNICAGLDALGFEFIEVGHGLGLGASKKLPDMKACESDCDYILGAKSVATNSKIGSFFIPGIGEIDDLAAAIDAGLDFVRIGANIDRFDEMLSAANFAKKKGLWVGLNLMKSYGVKSYEFVQIAKKIDSWGLSDAIYLVDSAGCMTPDEVFSYIATTRDFITTPMGFHGHNNLSLAVANSLAAAKAGATYIDTSILGMGRSAGNAQTEILTHLLAKEGLIANSFDQYQLYTFANKVVKPLMPVEQGVDGESIHVGVSKFHTSYMPLAKEVAAEFELDVMRLIKEVSDINCLNPNRKLFVDIANTHLAKNKN